MNCPICGSEVASDALFCTVCGATVQNQQPQAAVFSAPADLTSPKKEKKKKNTGLKIIAAVLVIVLLAVGGLFLVDTIMYNKEVDEEEIITDFPVLKKKTEFLVYNEEDFPSTEYRIQVEKIIGGGILKSEIFRRTETVIDDTSTEPVYNLDFKEDGNYIITLEDISDKNEPEDSAEETTEKDTAPSKVVIEVEVDDSDDEAIDKVDINSKEGDEPIEIPSMFIEATEEDLKAFSTFLGNMSWALCQKTEDINYDSGTTSAQYVVDNLILDPFFRLYQYFYGEFTSWTDPNTTPDPLSQFSQFNYQKLPEENIKWICENIFNVNYGDSQDNYVSKIKHHYLQDGYYYKDESWSDDDTTVWDIALLEQKVVDNKYEFTIESRAHDADNNQIDFRCTKKITAAIKEIDGKRYWSIYKIELAGTNDETNEHETESQPSTPDEISNEQFYEYIKDNLTISSSFPYDVNQRKGVFSALIEDFDSDGQKEMLTFSITHNAADQAYVVLDLYTVIDNAIVHSDTSKEIYASGAGNYEIAMCGVFDGSSIKIQYSSASLGYSSIGSSFLTYKVADDKLTLCNEYSAFEFYRYDSYEYEETVSGETFDSYEELYAAAENAGFDTGAHYHIGSENPEFDINTDDYTTAECFKGNHIFTLVDSVAVLGVDQYGFIHDNTNLAKNISA